MSDLYSEIASEVENILRWRKSISSFALEVCLPTILSGDIKLSKGQKEFFEVLSDLSIRKAILSGGRGTGKTLSLGILATWTVTILPYFYKRPFVAVILGGSFEQSLKVYRFCKRFFTRNEFLKRKLKREPIMSSTLLKDDSEIKALRASERQVRGPHGDLLIIDEATLVEENVLHESFEIVAPSDIGRIILSSNPHLYASYFVDVWTDPLKYGYHRFSPWSQEDCHWGTMQEDVEMKRKTVSKARFSIEVLGIPYPTSATTVIPNLEDIKSCLVQYPLQRKGEEPGDVKTTLEVIK